MVITENIERVRESFQAWLNNFLRDDLLTFAIEYSTKDKDN